MKVNDAPVDLLGLLPQYFSRIKDFQAIMSTEEIELNILLGHIKQVYNNHFFQLMDEDTTADYEAILNMPRSPDDKLSFRRWRVLNRIRRRPLYSMPMLKEILNEMVGLEQWEIEADISAYFLKITIISSDYRIAREVQITLREIVPAHIDLEMVITEPSQLIGKVYIGSALLIREATILKHKINTPNASGGISCGGSILIIERVKL